jgi:hypothetical protein
MAFHATLKSVCVEHEVLSRSRWSRRRIAHPSLLRNSIIYHCVFFVSNTADRIGSNPELFGLIRTFGGTAPDTEPKLQKLTNTICGLFCVEKYCYYIEIHTV